ncbi:M15 family metallopeptidase [uncultured Shewanella sp.]|uniref:M15 family metallopeptidase n=1 Tax=Shewanella atlantica TaxID=271099 RepID=UPI002603BAFF|nr:M15 family metallopeptidase [uncultured Shewanella sp.]
MLTHTTSAYGLSSSHLVDYKGQLLEKETAKALKRMVLAAEQAGIKLRVCSAYRDFSRQLKIWNGKALGERPLLDSNSVPVDRNNKSDAQLLELILLWSALPGTSRHHWGTDIDVFDENTIEPNRLQLIPSEYAAGGPCAKLHTWLVEHAAEFGFFFPFQSGLSGVSAEPWHLSYHPVSTQILESFDIKTLKHIINESEIELKAEIMKRIDALVDEYVYTIAPPPDQL